MEDNKPHGKRTMKTEEEERSELKLKGRGYGYA